MTFKIMIDSKKSTPIEVHHNPEFLKNGFYMSLIQIS
jgi:hypothetical protein